MTNKELDQILLPAWEYYDQNKMEALGIEDTMKLAYKYNRHQWGKCEDLRRSLYETRFEELLQKNDESRIPEGAQIEDGFYLDTSLSLPYLDELLDEGNRIIEERSGRNVRDARYRSFFRNIVPPMPWSFTRPCLSLSPPPLW